MNIALLLKWAWQLVSGHQSLCCNILHAKYLKGINFLDANSHTGDSWLWKTITKNKEIMKEACCKGFGDDRTINIWKDPQVPYYPGFCPSPMGQSRMGYLYTFDFVTRKGTWNTTKLAECFPIDFIHAICKIDILDLGRFDRWWQTPNANGSFSTKSIDLLQALRRVLTHSLLLPQPTQDRIPCGTQEHLQLLLKRDSFLNLPHLLTASALSHQRDGSKLIVMLPQATKWRLQQQPRNDDHFILFIFTKLLLCYLFPFGW